MRVRLDARSASQSKNRICAAYYPFVGRAPYGYRVREQGKEATLEPDPLTAPIVRRIFDEYASGSGLQAIAERLTADNVLRPSAYDSRRNPQHVGSAWSKAAVRAIITNDRYVAQQVTSEPLDCGGCSIRCATRRQVALIPVEVYRQTQEMLARHRTSTQGSRPQGPGGRYVLRGLLRCALCQRLMQGTWNNATAYYRCRFPREYARANNVDHPPNVYLRESRLLAPLQDWIRGSLPAHLYGWSRQQPPAIRLRLVNRVNALRNLINDSGHDWAQSVKLYSALGIHLVYEPNHHLVQVRSEVVPGAVVLDSIHV